MLDSIYHDVKISLNSHFWHETIKILSLSMQQSYGPHYITLLNMLTASGLSILIHGITSLPDATYCNKSKIVKVITKYSLPG